MRERLVSLLTNALYLCMLLALPSEPSPNPQAPGDTRVQDQTNQELMLQFSRQSARELVAYYLQGPPYPLFVIHRLIDLADSAVKPSLRHAFSRETQPLTRQVLAAALVRLRDPDPQYFTYVATSARRAVSSDLEYSCEFSSTKTADQSTEFPLQFIEWAQGHNLSLSDALHRAAVELPAAVEALGEAADPRALPIMLRGLTSLNTCIVRTSAFGLARLHETVAVEPIIRACSTLSNADRRLTAKALLYFGTQRAQRAAASIIADPALVRRWRTEVKRRGWKSAMRDRAIP